ncbi:MAG: chemotaxis protein CheD [Lachnospiraceae bacterium]|nr:chemotaxis protein CheD [Candidatus Colinaster scatohippi]
MADMNVCSSPDSIITLGLGSCVGAVLYDPVAKVCGMVHVMLPDSTTIANNSNVAKFADTGVTALLDMVLKEGAKKERLIAKIAGGAQMFSVNKDSPMLRVGERNVAAVKEKLKQLGIRLVAEDTGNNYGRTVVFYPETGEYLIRAIGKEPTTI